ncbi:MAG: alpha/beta fold hydrolase [Kineosporiaceae bacterium]|nr:alpha/beta fold hydrolase [Aeromicrobium sp.]
MTPHDPDAPRGVILMLHGGQQRSHDPVQNKNSSWWRMALMARSLTPFAEEHDLALMLVQYRKRGWNNETDPDPVQDARFALAEIARRYVDLPIVVVGHSMGGRTACRIADGDDVVGVTALAPWLPEGEPTTAMAGKQLRVIHGTRDRWTSAKWSRDFVERCQGFAASATWTAMPGVGHFMLRRVGKWNRFVEDSVSDIFGLSLQKGAPTEGTP